MKTMWPKKPGNISMEEAASIPIVAITVWLAFVERGPFQNGQKVFIQAGSGGMESQHIIVNAFEGRGS